MESATVRPARRGGKGEGRGARRRARRRGGAPGEGRTEKGLGSPKQPDDGTQGRAGPHFRRKAGAQRRGPGSGAGARRVHILRLFPLGLIPPIDARAGAAPAANIFLMSSRGSEERDLPSRVDFPRQMFREEAASRPVRGEQISPSEGEGRSLF